MSYFVVFQRIRVTSHSLNLLIIFDPVDLNVVSSSSELFFLYSLLVVVWLRTSLLEMLGLGTLSSSTTPDNDAL